MVNISLRVLSKPDLEALPQIFKSLGTDWDERVLPSIGNEVGGWARWRRGPSLWGGGSGEPRDPNKRPKS